MEEDTQCELSQLSLSESAGSESLAEDLEEEYGRATETSEEVIEEFPESVFSFLQFVKQRSENAEKLILQETDATDTWTRDYFSVLSKHQPTDDYLAQLASECNEEPETFKKRVLADIEEDDRKDQFTSDNTDIENSNVKKDVKPADKLDGTDEIIHLCYVEVENSCKQKLQQWEKEQEKQTEINRAAVNTHKAVLEREIKEQDEKRENWKKKFEKELSRLSTLQQEQQEKLESDIKQNKEALDQDLKKHQNLINKIEADLIIERNAFEEQKTNAKKRLVELQYKSAAKIQAAFRGYRVYQTYAPILKQKKEDLKRQKELQHKMEVEKKELEHKIKIKLEEKRKKDEEKKKKEEIAKNRIDEAKRKEFLEQEMRQREYEKKKNEEKMRLEKAKLLKQEEKRKQRNNSTKSDSPAEDGQPRDEPNLALKMAEQTSKGSCEQEERQEGQSEIQHGKDVIKVNNNERNTFLERLSDNGLDEVNRASSTDTDNSPPIPGEDFKESCKSIERESTSAMLTGLVTSNEAYQIVRNSQCQTPLDSGTLNSGVLSDEAEAKRLAWIKSCKPWSKILRDNQKVEAKKTRQRKSSAAKQLPPLKEALILHNSPWQFLEQVTTVTLQDLPGCSLSTLSKCIKLKYLSMRRCGLTALDGLSHCVALQYIDVQENCISIINCEGLMNLGVLLLNKNQITSIHGLEDCGNLMNLELSFNLITRIAGLESLRNLHRLVLDHNQLISTKALKTTSLLTYLDCSYNYLTELEGIQNCGLMQILKLQGNNLSEIPRLDNHVLMKEIYLDDNNLTTLTDLSSYWLPLLQVFTISQNSITHLPPLDTFISLEELNLSSNCLSELQTVSMWLEGCRNLKKLSISKNPFLQEHNWRFTLQKTLPALRFLNGEEINCNVNEFLKTPPGSFMALCQHQISNISKLWHIVNDDESRVSSSSENLEIYCKSLKEILQLSNVYRYAHEFGDTEVANGEDPEVPRGHICQLDLYRSQHSSHIINGPHEDKRKDTEQITFQVQSLLEESFVNVKQNDQADSRESMKNPAPQQSVTCTRKSMKEHSRELCAAIIIQSQWRGYVIRRDINYYARLHEAASVIQSAWRHYYSKKKSFQKKSSNLKILEVKQQAATVIQAAWKGFSLRKKLAAAVAGIAREELEDEFEEVNLDEFTFDENVFDEGWSVDSAHSHSRLLHLFSKPEQPKKYVHNEDKEYSLSWFPQEAWTDPESSSKERERKYEKDGLGSRSEKPNLSHVYSMKSNTDISIKSEKEEKISQEWGFKEASTAQLMLKRAQKMKSKQAKHKKLLDPAVRLALFKNNENKHTLVMPPKKAQQMKTEYFRGKEEELCHLKELHSEALARSRELTYQWLHTQCGDINTTSSATSKCKRFLPELNHDVLNGRRVQLVTNTPLSKEVDDLDLLSIKSGTTLSQNREEKMKTQSTGTLSNRNLFTPVKTNSGPQRKERISFRDNPVQFSGGWGGGKKKGKSH